MIKRSEYADVIVVRHRKKIVRAVSVVLVAPNTHRIETLQLEYISENVSDLLEYRVSNVMFRHFHRIHCIVKEVNTKTRNDVHAWRNRVWMPPCSNTWRPYLRLYSHFLFILLSSLPLSTTTSFLVFCLRQTEARFMKFYFHELLKKLINRLVGNHVFPLLT